MALNHALRGTLEFDGTAQVDDGTLVVNDDFTRNGATFSVASGAYLGGTGTVSTVTLAEGAGFAAFQNQKAPLTVTGNVSLPAAATVRIVLDGSGRHLRNTPFLVSSGSLSGTENVANWNVVVTGDAEESLKPNLYAVVAIDRTLSVVRANGTAILIR